jgi:hypothetical protein
MKLRYFAVVYALVAAAGLLQAGAYNASNPTSLGPGNSTLVWSAETPTPGNGTTAASQQVFLGSGPGGGNTPFSVDGHFSGAPGAFEVDAQVASADNDTDYQTCSGCNITSVDATNNTFHLDAGQAVARYVRLLMRTRTNSVSITARINR